MKIGNHEVIHNENRTTFLLIYDLDGVCQDCIYLEKIRPLFEEKDKKIETLEKGLEYAKRIEKDYKTKFDKAIEYVNTHKPSDTISFPLMKKDEENQVKSCFDYEFREIYQKELLDILQGNKWNEVERAYLDDKPIGSEKE